jgi:hypothetical protein
MNDDKTDKNQPDLDLISMVQRARMQHDASATPSQVSGVYWIESKPRVEITPTSRAGEWVIETDLDAVDALWSRIKQATEDGILGYKAKVSTAPRGREKPLTQRVILVRTVDADDAADVARVRASLTALGVTGDLRYVRISE